MANSPIADTEVHTVLDAIEKFIGQRPGLDYADYGGGRDGLRAYRAEVRSIGKDLTRARQALTEARAITPPQGVVLADSFRAFSGRLEWVHKSTNDSSEPCGDCNVQPGCTHTAQCRGGHHLLRSCLTYCTGQYFPTEYRKAGAAVLETYVSACARARNADTPQTFTYSTIADVRAANRAVGGHWFDRSSMAFFNTRVCSTLLRGNRFITRERMNSERDWKWSVRVALPDGSIDTLGEFCAYSSLEDARDAARQGVSA